MSTRHDVAATEDFRIDPVREDELGVLCDLITAFAAFQGTDTGISATPELLGAHLLGDGRYAEAVMVRLGGEIAGYCIYFYSFSSFLARPVLFIEDIYLEPRARGRGYGRQILDYLRDRARERGCGRLEWCVETRNTPAVRFYEGLGAAMVPDRVQFRWSVD